MSQNGKGSKSRITSPQNYAKGWTSTYQRPHRIWYEEAEAKKCAPLTCLIARFLDWVVGR
jgi:hypothetical protein